MSTNKYHSESNEKYKVIKYRPRRFSTDNLGFKCPDH